MIQLRTKQSPSGIVHKVIAGIENALWDIKAKSLDVPVYELFGGPIRKEIPTYWSHCGTFRLNFHLEMNRPQPGSLEDIRKIGLVVLCEITTKL